MSVYISLGSLVVIMLACVFGVLSPWHKDSLLERVGMAGLCIASLGAFNRILHEDFVSPASALAHVSIAAIAVAHTCRVVAREWPAVARQWADTTVTDEDVQASPRRNWS